MITRKDWKTLEAVILAPAKKPNPADDSEVEIIVIGLYEVTGSKGSVYEVRIGLSVSNDPFASCTCKGALFSTACRHIKAAWPVHLSLVMTDFAAKQRKRR